MNFLENQPLSQYTTMRIGGPARYLVELHNSSEIAQIVDFSETHNMPTQVIGDGSNIIFGDDGFEGLVIVNRIKGFSLENNGLAVIGAGENWDEIVEKSIDAGFSGIEAMSLIPGTVGATPINNVGAYGQEIKDTLVNVHAYDLHAKKFVELSNKECGFAYRNSIFKTSEYGRYIICTITLQLLRVDENYQPPAYASLQQKISEYNTVSPQLVRQVVIELRSSKLPDPQRLANTGSFFKNPIVSAEKAAELNAAFPDMPVYTQDDGQVKLSAGWMIDNLDLRGYSINGFKIYDKQALVIVNESSKSFEDLRTMIDFISKKVHDAYGITLEVEPEIFSK
jgi:UDP-N-acetylmuramate dehydrogenase